MDRVLLGQLMVPKINMKFPTELHLNFKVTVKKKVNIDPQCHSTNSELHYSLYIRLKVQTFSDK